MALNSEEVRAYYDTRSLDKIKNYVFGNARVESAKNALFSGMPENPIRVFEIGCGIGYIGYEIVQLHPNCLVTAFDISKKSVEIARKLFPHPNIEYLQADRLQALSIPDGLQYDMIFMMDVFEHIPVEERQALFTFIKNKLSVHGRIFLSCPTPAFLQWLKKEQPHTIQPIDENIDLVEILDLITATETYLIYYKLMNIWHQGDYFHALLTKQVFKPKKTLKVVVSSTFVMKVLRKISVIFAKNRRSSNYAKELIKQRKDLVEQKLQIQL